jgi:Raf kinase inhibitor-like YbhB/YbcL family protein
MKHVAFIGFAFLSVVACGTGSNPADASSADTSTLDDGSGMDGTTAGDTGADVASGPMVLTSSAYMEGQKIPTVHECSPAGQNQSMPLAWTPGPQGTQSYAIVMRDLDFQMGFIHWVIWDIPANVMSLPQDVQHAYQPSIPAGAKQAPFNGQVTGYYGPCSPNSVNTYELTLYAIPTATIAGLTQMTSKAQAATAIVNAATATAKLSGES